MATNVIRNSKALVLLWENQAPTTAFSEQDVTLSDDMTNYTLIKIVYIVNGSGGAPYVEITSEFDGANGRAHGMYWGSTSTEAYFIVRQATARTNNTITFANVFHVPNLGSVSQSSLIPYKIYGIR